MINNYLSCIVTIFCIWKVHNAIYGDDPEWPGVSTMWDWYQQRLHWICLYFGSLTYSTSSDELLNELVHVLLMVFLLD